MSSGLHLSCTWPISSEELVTENEDCNDFDPLLSQQWGIGVTLLDDLPVLLTDAVNEYFKLSTRRETIEQLLGKIQNADGKTLISLGKTKRFSSLSRSNRKYTEYG